MKYLINKETKEHTVLTDTTLWSSKDWTLVEADDEGWIAHTGNECPLPDDVFCELKLADGFLNTRVRAATSWWHNVGHHSIVAYRPILTESEPVQEPDYDPRSVSFNLLDRLKAAHKAAQTIPDLEAELREVLGAMGYELVSRSPFVEPESIKNPLSAKITLTSAEPDMSDWRNWREGDLVECVDSEHHECLRIGDIVELRQSANSVPFFKWIDGRIHAANAARFRFHSRPAKGE